MTKVDMGFNIKNNPYKEASSKMRWEALLIYLWEQSIAITKTVLGIHYVFILTSCYNKCIYTICLVYIM